MFYIYLFTHYLLIFKYICSLTAPYMHINNSFCLLSPAHPFPHPTSVTFFLRSSHIHDLFAWFCVPQSLICLTIGLKLTVQWSLEDPSVCADWILCTPLLESVSCPLFRGKWKDPLSPSPSIAHCWVSSINRDPMTIGAVSVNT